jgi:Tol biopolymer transport system component
MYKKPIDGGSAVPITDSPLDEGRPRWSPDGTEITFVRIFGDSSVVMVVPAEGGTPYEVVSGEEPVWSPSGLEIAFVSNRTGQAEVRIVSRDSVGGAWSEATQFTASGLVPGDWAPDSSGVLCVPPWPSDEMVVVSLENEVLWRYDFAAVGLHWAANLPRFSRDGSTIYVWGLRDDGLAGIWAVPVLGGEPSLVVEMVGTLRALMFSLGPDRLYVTVAEHESDIWVMDVEVER